MDANKVQLNQQWMIGLNDRLIWNWKLLKLSNNDHCEGFLTSYTPWLLFFFEKISKVLFHWNQREWFEMIWNFQIIWQCTSEINLMKNEYAILYLWNSDGILQSFHQGISDINLSSPWWKWVMWLVDDPPAPNIVRG